MFATLKYKCLFGLTCLFVSLTPQIAWGSEEICKAALKSNSNKLQDLARLEKLIEKRSNLHKIDCDGRSLFYVAYSKSKHFPYFIDVRTTRYDNLILLLENDYKINEADAKGNTLLHLAALKGDINVIYLLLERGAKINAQNEDKDTPLHLAVRKANKEAVNLLLHFGADRDKRNKDKRTPLNIALYETYSEKIEKVEILLQYGAQLSDKKLDNLKIAIGFGNNRQIVPLIERYLELREKKLLSSNPPPPITHPQLIPGKWDSALYIATSHNDITTVKKLLSQGINVDSLGEFRRGEYETPLHFAIRNGYEDIARLLIESGADVRLQNSNGSHPLIMAVNNLNMTQLLLDNGAIVNQKTPKSEMTALIWSNKIEVSKVLLKKGANINHASEYGYTPLSRAIIFNNLPLVEFLIDRGADVNQRALGDTPLSHALDEKDIKLIKLLLNKGANPSLPDNNGWTLFLGVTGANNIAMVKLFLNYVDLDAINQAYDKAVLLDHSELEGILKQAGGEYFDKEKLFDDAVKSLRTKTVTRLLNEGMDKYLRTDKGSDNLIRVFGSSILLSQENYELMRLLLDNGANVNDIYMFPGRTNVYTTPLIFSIEVYDETSILINILLEYGANVNAHNHAGVTALYKAIAKPFLSGCENWGWRTSKDVPAHKNCTEDSLKTIKLLLEYGAEIDIETKKGSIEDLISEMKQSDRNFGIDFANKVELLLNQYRQTGYCDCSNQFKEIN